MARKLYIIPLMALSIPPRELLVTTNVEDPLPFYFSPLTGGVFRKRLANTLAMLDGGPAKYRSLLEIAFGSGILLPELAHRTEKLYGIDNHPMISQVGGMLKTMGLSAELSGGDLFKMPYADGQFHAVVAVSVLEHFKDLDPALAEIDRVLAPDGVVVLSFPVRNWLTDKALDLFDSGHADHLARHPSSHRDIIAAAEKRFRVERTLLLPRFLPMDLTMYCSIRCAKKAIG